MRRKSQQNNFGGKRRHSNGRGGPKKNYGAMKEKYLNQAREAQSSGDRVMAEYYYQHAEHCFRMLAEEAANNNNRPQRPQNNRDDEFDDEQEENSRPARQERTPVPKAETKDAEQLPAFITSAQPDSADEPMAEAKE